MRVGKVCPLLLNPGIPKIKVDKDYDVFFAVFEKPSELLSVSAVQGWKDHCKTSICWLTEFYVREMASFKSALKVLSEFDHVIFMFDKSEPFKNIIQGEGSYMPSGIDAFLFCPYPNFPKRFIDVLSIGRRSQRTHQALLRMARDKNLLYVYDTINDLQAYNIAEHRFLFANLAKRSKYFIVNPGKINATHETGGQSEFGYRYFEGAAPGTIMIGDTPN
ncbi:MAG: glycosyltransferase, partial [Thermodesulfobacteriota bacterium]